MGCAVSKIIYPINKQIPEIKLVNDSVLEPVLDIEPNLTIPSLDTIVKLSDIPEEIDDSIYESDLDEELNSDFDVTPQSEENIIVDKNKLSISETIDNLLDTFIHIFFDDN